MSQYGPYCQLSFTVGVLFLIGPYGLFCGIAGNVLTGDPLTDKYVALGCVQRHSGLPCRGWIHQVWYGVNAPL